MNDSDLDILADKLAERLRPQTEALTQAQVTAMIGFSCKGTKVSQTVRDVLNSPEFPAPFFIGRSKRWRRVDIVAWINGLHHQQIKLNRLAATGRAS